MTFLSLAANASVNKYDICLLQIGYVFQQLPNLEQFCCGVYSRADLVLLVVLIGYTRVALAISLHQLNKFLIKLNTIVIFIG